MQPHGCGIVIISTCLTGAEGQDQGETYPKLTVSLPKPLVGSGCLFLWQKALQQPNYLFYTQKILGSRAWTGCGWHIVSLLYIIWGFSWNVPRLGNWSHPKSGSQCWVFTGTPASPAVGFTLWWLASSKASFLKRKGGGRCITFAGPASKDL